MEYVEGTPITAVDTPRKLSDMAVQMSDGRVKILDFGLAKAAHEEIGADDATRTVRVGGRPLTEPGTTVGTIAYMSPEQARGQTNLTAQSDQFSLGLVLYELAVGKRAFQRASAAETMTAIIREDAEPLPGTVPAPLRWVVERLLRKEPAERYDSTRDLYRELRQLRDHLSESASASTPAVEGKSPRAGPTTKRRVLVAIGLAAVLMLGAALAALLIQPEPADFSAYKFTPISLDEASEWDPVWSPDGKSIAYTADIYGIAQVFTKVVGSRDTIQLTHGTNLCSSPFWSPDGATIYYASRGGLWAVGASGGNPEMVLDKIDHDGNPSLAKPWVALHPDGKTLVFRRDGRTWAGELRGGAPKELRIPEIPDAVPTAFSPDGFRLLVRDRDESWILPWPAGMPRRIGSLQRYVSAVWLPDSRHFPVSSEGSTGNLSILDVTDGSSRVIYRSPDWIIQASVSRDGRKIAYSVGTVEWNILEISLPDGQVRTRVGGGGTSWLPEWAPSGTHFLYSTSGSGTPSAIEDRSAAEDSRAV